MELLNLDELKMLTKERHEPCVSIYIPTHTKGAEIVQDPIRLKNHLQDIARSLNEQDFNSLMVQGLLRPVYGLLEDNSFWNYQAESLAVFAAKDEFQYYRLPVKVNESHHISNRFYIKPLLPLINRSKDFFLLTLDQKSINLYKASPFRIEKVELRDVPQNLTEFLGIDESEQKKYYRSETGSQNMRFYSGPAAGTDDARQNREILRFFQGVDKGIYNTIKEENLALMLAGVNFLLPLYREANSYPKLLDAAVSGGVGDLGTDEIHRQALEKMSPFYEEEERKALTKYGELSNSERTSTTMGEIIKAAFAGRVEALFINPRLQQWGVFDPKSFSVKLHKNPREGDDDIMELAAIQTILHGGSVYEFEENKMPKGKSIAAVFRY